MTGTKDDSPIGDTKAAERRVPFDLATAKDQYLLIFEGGDHMIFSGRGRSNESDARFQALIKSASTAFWDAYLRNDPKAKAWLRDGAFKELLEKNGTFELR
jgi:hypothetical protein